MAIAGDTVWGLHEFVAENADEVSFKVGEAILVVEKDDEFGDGWWQGTNAKGDTGLFPFSYATEDKELAENAKALALSAGGGDQAHQDSHGMVMNSTMADVDKALTELRGAEPDTSRTTQASRRSFQSERTGDLSADEDGTEEGESEYRSRSNARAALAAKAKANATSQLQKDKEDQIRMREQAKKAFEEEEARHRELLLQKEEERKIAAAKGQLPLGSPKPKVAPIEGVDISDDSDSEGSANGLETYADKSKTREANAATALASNGIKSSPSGGQQALPAVEKLALDENQRQEQRDPDVADELDDTPSTKNAAQQQAGVPAPGNQQIDGTASSLPQDLSESEQRVNSFDQQSFSSSAKQSQPETTSMAGTATNTAATSLAAKDTPKSTNVPLFQATPGSPAASSVAVPNRPSAPSGDPQDWSVDQVVEWARSRGWDESSIVSKFQEHEISGDVLLEMDVNILKEIDIIAFGKRFQVANAIKELKGQGGLSPMAGFTPSSNSGRIAGSGQSYHSGDSVPAATASSAAAAAAGLSSGIGLGVPSGQSYSNDLDVAGANNRAASHDTGTIIHHGSPRAPRDRDVTGGSMPASGSTTGSQAMSLSAMADAALLNRAGNNLSPPPQQGSIPSTPSVTNASPRKRSSKVPGSAERSSFFAGFNSRQRKPPAAAPGGTSAIAEEEGRAGRGTLSRFGLNRLGKSGHGSGDFKNQISLPTSSPTYDSQGDTARRDRASAFGTSSNDQGAGPALGGYEAAIGGGHGRPASIGSVDPEQNKESTLNVTGPQQGDGPVMSRIRPVDLEGWMRKKGERYNVWKPRYLALKGNDLVILRDPQAPKIKGYVSMKGYKVIADENTNPGKYGFKILHESEKPHYFSSDDPILVREWMKGLMKATIGRDASFPVISSYNNATISLKEAQSMYPPPRPPSPASRARTQRAKARQNPGELTAKDAAVLMGISQPQGGQTGM
ncbi:unnamed protein product [Sympodiomycopsis kandeliae]